MVEEHQGIRLPVELQQVPSRILEVLSQLGLNDVASCNDAPT